jgi:hypothetical protein
MKNPNLNYTLPSKKRTYNAFKYILPLVFGLLCFAGYAYNVWIDYSYSKYGASGIAAKEGSMWYDVKNAVYLITLGKQDNIKTGVVFDIIDEDEVIGKVKTSKVFAETSVVDLVDLDDSGLEKKYYKIVSK